MKLMKFHIAAPTTENLFFAILWWYMIGAASILVILVIAEWLIQIW